MSRRFSEFARLLYRTPVGRSNQYGLGRNITPPLGKPYAATRFVAPRRTPCIDPDYDQANEARLRSKGQHLTPGSWKQPSWKQWKKVGEDSFQSFRDEYHQYHHPFRAGLSQDSTHLFRKSGLGVKQAIAQLEQRRRLTQLWRRWDTTPVEQDPAMLELMTQMIKLEEGLGASCANIIQIRNEIMVLDCSFRHTRFKI